MNTSVEIVTNATAQKRIEQDGKEKRFFLHINGKNILDRFKEQLCEVVPMPDYIITEKNKGLKL